MSARPTTGAEIRDAFLRFFESKNHQIVQSASLVPDADPSLLFVNAGMVPFKSVFLGEENRDYSRATSSQKCLRVSGKHNDLENVGRTPRHHTFFEMLGNFSFGDYFKKDAIVYAWEFLTDVMGLDPASLAVSVYLDDEEAAEIWKSEVGIPDDKLFRLGESENFWSMGDTGPCGPCSEIHMDFGKGVKGPCDSDACDPSCECGRWLEIWNLVFMQFNRDASGEKTSLPKPSIDTGAGLERLAAVSQGVARNYDTDLFTGIIGCIETLSKKKIGDDEEHDVSMRVIADHVRALTFLIGDGILPSNEGRGYVLRRILRRAARHGVFLGQEKPFLFEVSGAVIDEMGGAYPELVERRSYIADRIKREEERFLKTLSKGLAILEEEVALLQKSKTRELSGAAVFKLYDTYGFPVDLTADILRDRDLVIDQAGFDVEMSKQRERARAAWKGSGDEKVQQIYGELASQHDTEKSDEHYRELAASTQISALVCGGKEVEIVREGDEVEIVVPTTPFYAESGGQVGDHGLIRSSDGAEVQIDTTQRPIGNLVVHRGTVVKGELRTQANVELVVDEALRADTARNHSGTHLLHAALRQVLGPQAMQKGSLVTPTRLRFDFTHDAPLSEDELEKIESMANEWIAGTSNATIRSMPYKQAVEAGAMALFSEKYGDEVRVVSFGDYSTELCGGCHVENVGDIALIKIVSEGGIAAGVRRLEALTGRGALEYLRQREQLLAQAARKVGVRSEEILQRLDKILDERQVLEAELKKLRKSQQGAASQDLASSAQQINSVSVVASRVEDVDAKALRPMVDELRNKLGSGVVLLAAVNDERVSLALGVTPDLTKRFKAGDLIRQAAETIGGKGGGRPDFAQAGGKDASKLEEAFAALRASIEAG
ncbi:MAG: alanine--tRNA ligase [Deltaproteobacteria bacterium]|nr:alanine--tRNA ligase [Deltaproteobacteria bacterium]